MKPVKPGADSAANANEDPNAGPRGARRATSEGALEHLWQFYWDAPSDARRNEIVEAYQGLVEEVVRRFAARLPRSIDRGDLRTAANVGLMSAVASYDPSRGVRFESYGEMRVRGALLDELRTQDWLPRPWRQRLELQKRAIERLRAEHNREPKDEEIATAMGISLGEYRGYFGTGLPGLPHVSRGAPQEDSEGPLGVDVIADARPNDPGERLTRAELLRLVAQRLSEQEYRVVYLKYWEELPMREIGELLGLSESRVCKIHAQLLERLKDRFRADAPAE